MSYTCGTDELSQREEDENVRRSHDSCCSLEPGLGSGLDQDDVTEVLTSSEVKFDECSLAQVDAPHSSQVTLAMVSKQHHLVTVVIQQSEAFTVHALLLCSHTHATTRTQHDTWFCTSCFHGDRRCDDFKTTNSVLCLHLLLKGDLYPD